MNARTLLLSALACSLLACASTGDGAAKPAAPGTGSDPAAAGSADAPTAAASKEGPQDELTKSALYKRIDTLVRSWQASSAEPGPRAAEEAEAMGMAVAREVGGRLETILGDLRTSGNPRWRAAAAAGLGFYRDDRIRPALEDVLRDPDARLLCSALVSLARYADPATDDARVAPLLRSSDPVVRGNAALCLARVFHARGRQGIPVVSPADRVAAMEADLAVLLFDAGDAIVRGNAAQALGELGSPGSEDALLNCLRDDAVFVRLKAAGALALCGSTRSYPPLLDALGREGEENVRTMLVLGLGFISERQGRKPAYADLGTDAAKWRTWLQR